MKRILLVIGVLCLLSMVLPVSATPTNDGPAWDTNSWASWFHDTGNLTPIDHIQMQMITGTFELVPGGATGWDPGWSSANTLTQLIADGTPDTDLYWTFNFNGESTDPPVSMWYKAYYLGQAVAGDEGLLTVYGGGGSSWQAGVTPFTGELSAPTVPEPMSMALGFMGLSTLAGYAKLRRRKA